MAIEEPKIKRAVAFIDGQNLYRHAKDAFGHHHPNYDVQKLFHFVCDKHGWETKAVRFYTGTPGSAEAPMWHSYWNNRLLAMRRAGILVTARPIRYHREEITLPDGSRMEITTPQEKGIDVRLALDIVRLARQAQFEVGVIFSQDQDLAEVVEEVREISRTSQRWIKLVSAFPGGSQATSRMGVRGTDWFPIDEEAYSGCLDPRDYRPKGA